MRYSPFRVGIVASLVPWVVACTEDERGPPAEEGPYLGLSQPENGFQVRTVGTRVAPGDDVEYCEVAELPGEPSDTYYVRRIELGNGERSHHLAVDVPLEGTEAEDRLADARVGDRVECTNVQSSFGETFQLVGLSQQLYNDVEFPEGVGRLYHGGQRIVFDYHYYNTGTEPIEARSAANFHLAEEGTIEHVARTFAFNNGTIDTPPNSASTFTAECRFTQDVTVSSLTRHTHRWGKDFSVSFLGGERGGEHFWTSHDFQEDVEYAFDEPIVVKAGEGFTYACSYDNTESRPLRFGANATDEMCILFGEYWEGAPGQTLEMQDCNPSTIGADGIARIAEENGGYRPPTPDEVERCVSLAEQRDRPPECIACACDACGGVLADCQADPDCSAIVDCTTNTRCTTDCAEVCAEVINAHSPGTGMVLQVGECLSSDTCASVCPPAQ
jgi:hypothetical protein